ncbi:MAG: hypothetical protein IJ412_10075 [Oscillospiraceae bacterium]|nr:hypothetical protein [Oscillospiraceae bacterium]
MTKRVKEAKAYQDGLTVGEALMEAAVQMAAVDGEGEKLNEDMERDAMKILCAVCHLEQLMEASEYVRMLPCFFRSMGEIIPETLRQYEQHAYMKYSKFFAFGVSLYIYDNMEEWDDWLFDNDLISASEYQARVGEVASQSDVESRNCSECPHYPCELCEEEDAE